MNSEPYDQSMRIFFQVFSFQNIIKDKTYFKSSYNPSCTDFVLINRPKSFPNSTVLQCCSTIFSDFQQIFINSHKDFLKIQSPSIMRYQNNRNFDNKVLMNDAKNSISQELC